ncbi:MAG: hypothetical protein RI990_1914, partial [Planctomycetota bacterium]
MSKSTPRKSASAAPAVPAPAVDPDV